ncbi:MAG: AAA family ATPase [Acidobacteriota bacterium]
MVVAFLGTKGGTGTTTMAVNCAAGLQRLTNQSTLVVDVKRGSGDVAVFLDLRPRYTLADLLDHVGWTDVEAASRFVTNHPCGIDVLAASEGFTRPGSRDAEGVEQSLRTLSRRYDFVVVDAGCLLTTPTVSALLVADLVLLVANPDLPCLRNLRRLTDALRLAGVAPERLRLVLNRASEHAVLSATLIEQALDRRIDFQIASDYRAVSTAINGGVPVSSQRQSVLAAQVDTMASTLIDQRVLLSTP